MLTDGRFEMGIGPGGLESKTNSATLGLPVIPPSARLAQVRETVTTLRDLDGPDAYTPVVMAVRGPKDQALAADLADTCAQMPEEDRVEITRVVHDFRTIRRLSSRSTWR